MIKEELLKELSNFLKETCNPYLYGYRSPSDSKNDLSSDEFQGFNSESWVIGGMTGGNCWGGEADQPISSDDPSELTLLDEFLEQKMPETSFLKYKKLRNFIKTKEWGCGEYYGNFNIHKCYYITFEDIAECLAEN